MNGGMLRTWKAGHRVASDPTWAGDAAGYLWLILLAALRQEVPCVLEEGLLFLDSPGSEARPSCGAIWRWIKFSSPEF